MFEGCDGRVCDVWSLHSSNCLLPSSVCCLSRLLNILLCRGLIFITAVRFGRNRDAASRTACHSIILETFFLVDFDSGQRSAG